MIGYDERVLACPPAVHEHLRQAIRLLDNAEELALAGHTLLCSDAPHEVICQAATLLTQAGFMRVAATRRVRDAWAALHDDADTAGWTPDRPATG